MPSATVYLTSTIGVTGIITFTQPQPSDYVDIKVNINSNTNSITDGLHALRYHIYGDISNGPHTTGPVFNLNGTLQDVNVIDGKVDQTQKSHQISLFGGIENPLCIIGRAVVFYSGSTMHGIAQPIAWGVIGVSSGE